MKRLLITIAAIIISVCTFAQMVPDQFTETVTLTDQDGNTHDINAYLRDGLQDPQETVHSSWLKKEITHR